MYIDRQTFFPQLNNNHFISVLLKISISLLFKTLCLEKIVAEVFHAKA